MTANVVFADILMTLNLCKGKIPMKSGGIHCGDQKPYPLLK